MSFSPTTNNRLVLAIVVPTDRVLDTNLNMDLEWSPSTNAAVGEEVEWSLQVRSVPLGADVDPAAATASALVRDGGTVADQHERTTATFGGSDISNGDLLTIDILRQATQPMDDHPGAAQLHAVSIRYTATS